MRLALLTGAAALSLVGAAGAQAQTIYTTDPAAVVAQAPVIATTPAQVIAVPGPPFGPLTPQYIVTQPTVVVAPSAVAPRERVIERERVVVSPQRAARGSRVAAPRERVIERERIVTAPAAEMVVAPSETVTTGYSAGGSCFIDLRGVERCY
jgi:hypothetical protein